MPFRRSSASSGLSLVLLASACWAHGPINSVEAGGVVKTSGQTRGVCKKTGDFTAFKGFLVEFVENRRS